MFVNHIHLKPAVIRADATLESYLALADTLQFEGGVCFAPFSYELEQANISQNGNQWLAGTIKRHSELVGYGTLNPNKEPADQIKEIADLGFRGIKLHPPAQKFDILGDWTMKAYASMVEHDLIADFHLGVHWYRLQAYDPLKADEIAFHFPNLKMVFEHVGGWHYYRQVLAVITNNQHRGNHLYAGIASVLNRESQRYWYLGPQGVEDCRWQIGPDLLIYGLDFPYNQEKEIRRDLELIHTLGWPPEDLKALLGGNLQRLLSRQAGTTRIIGGDPNPSPATKV